MSYLVFQFSEDPRFPQTQHRPHRCAVCGKGYATPWYLNQHAKTHTDQELPTCDVCGRRCTTSTNLKSHQRSHRGKRPYSCENCGKTFAKFHKQRSHTRLCQARDKVKGQGNVSRKQRRRTAKGFYSCDFCQKQFVKSASLKEHRVVHTGERPYPCDFCGQRFTQRGSLLTHKRRHTGGKPYSCSQCGKRFRYAALLKAHAKRNALNEVGTEGEWHQSHKRSDPRDSASLTDGPDTVERTPPHTRPHTGQGPTERTRGSKRSSMEAKSPPEKRSCGGESPTSPPEKRSCGGESPTSPPEKRSCGGESPTSPPEKRSCGGESPTSPPDKRSCGGESPTSPPEKRSCGGESPTSPPEKRSCGGESPKSLPEKKSCGGESPKSLPEKKSYGESPTRSETSYTKKSNTEDLSEKRVCADATPSMVKTPNTTESTPSRKRFDADETPSMTEVFPTDEPSTSYLETPIVESRRLPDLSSRNPLHNPSVTDTFHTESLSTVKRPPSQEWFDTGETSTMAKISCPERPSVAETHLSKGSCPETSPPLAETSHTDWHLKADNTSLRRCFSDNIHSAVDASHCEVSTTEYIQSERVSFAVEDQPVVVRSRNKVPLKLEKPLPKENPSAGKCSSLPTLLPVPSAPARDLSGGKHVVAARRTYGVETVPKGDRLSREKEHEVTEWPSKVDPSAAELLDGEEKSSESKPHTKEKHRSGEWNRAVIRHSTERRHSESGHSMSASLQKNTSTGEGPFASRTKHTEERCHISGKSSMGESPHTGKNTPTKQRWCACSRSGESPRTDNMAALGERHFSDSFRESSHGGKTPGMREKLHPSGLSLMEERARADGMPARERYAAPKLPLIGGRPHSSNIP